MLSELLPEAKRKLHEIEQKVLELEEAQSSSKICRYSDLDVLAEFEQISLGLNDLEKLLAKESKAKREDYRRRITHLRSTEQHMHHSLETLLRRNGKDAYSLQRMALFGSSSSSTNSKDDLELELAENGSLARSTKMVGEYLSIGRDTLNDLVSQRERLKGLQRKALDIFNYLGLSNTLMKGVEQRDLVDKWIVYIGIFVTLLIIVLIYWFVKK